MLLRFGLGWLLGYFCKQFGVTAGNRWEQWYLQSEAKEESLKVCIRLFGLVWFSKTEFIWFDHIETVAVYLSQDSLWSIKAFQLDVCNENMRIGTPLAFVTLLQKKSTINIFYKESCTLVLGKFSSSPLSPGQRCMGNQNNQPLLSVVCRDTFQLCQPAPVSARMEFYFPPLTWLSLCQNPVAPCPLAEETSL